MNNSGMHFVTGCYDVTGWLVGWLGFNGTFNTE